MSEARPGTAIVGAVVATVLALWLSYAVAAGLMQGAPGPSGAPQSLGAAPVGLTLTPVPELRMRPALHKRAAEARAIAQPAPPRSVRAATSARPAKEGAPAQAPPPAMSAPPAPATTTPAPQSPVTQAPAATPTPTPKVAPKPRPTLAAHPIKPARPDFDESAPSGFDTSG
jgi:hypothetical protein